MFIKVKYKKRNDKDSIPRSSVYESDTLTLGHRATYPVQRIRLDIGPLMKTKSSK